MLSSNIEKMKKCLRIRHVFIIFSAAPHWSALTVCSVQVTALTADCSLSSIIQVLRVTQYAGYPVVDEERHVLGFVTRIQLAQALCEHEADVDPTVEVLKYADISPEIINWNASALRAFKQFSATGMQHICLL